MSKRRGVSSAKDAIQHDRDEEALQEFERLSRESSRDGQRWHKVGVKMTEDRDFDRAYTALTQAITYLGYRNQSAMYNMACMYALKGDREAALDWLEKSINAGFDGDKLRKDEDLASLYDEPRFKKLEGLSRTLSLSQFLTDDKDDSTRTKQRWQSAITLYETFLKSEPDNGRGWFNLGYALQYSGEHTRAVTAFEKALQLGYRKPTSMYNMGCAYAMLRQTDQAMQWIESAYEAGFDLHNFIGYDRDLDSLRGDPRFKQLQEKVGAVSAHKEKGSKDKHK
jgi:Flp pilus assembly protein TadD